SDQDRRKSNRQDVQMPNRGRGKRQRISQTNQQAKSGFDGPASLLIAVDKNQRADDQRGNARDSGVLLRLGHLIEFQQWLAGQSDIQPRHFPAGFLDQHAYPPDRLRIEIIGGRLRRHEINLAVGKSNINFLLRFGSRVEQGSYPWGRWRSRTAQG